MSCYDETGKIMFCIICNSDLKHLFFVSSSERKTFSSQIYQTHHFLYWLLNICIRNQWSHIWEITASDMQMPYHYYQITISWHSNLGREACICVCVWWQIIELFRFDLKWNVFKWNQFEIRIHLRIMYVCLFCSILVLVDFRWNVFSEKASEQTRFESVAMSVNDDWKG